MITNHTATDWLLLPAGLLVYGLIAYVIFRIVRGVVRGLRRLRAPRS